MQRMIAERNLAKCLPVARPKLIRLPLVSVTIGAFAPESEVAELLRQAEQANDGVSIGSYPFFKQGKVGGNFVVRSEDEALARRVSEELGRDLEAAGYAVTEGGI